MNEAGLTTGSVAGSGASGGGRIKGAETSVHNKLAEIWGFAESDRGRFDEEVLDGWIQGEDVEAFSKNPFESVEAWIISSSEGKVMGVTGGVRGGVVMESFFFSFYLYVLSVGPTMLIGDLR